MMAPVCSESSGQAYSETAKKKSGSCSRGPKIRPPERVYRDTPTELSDLADQQLLVNSVRTNFLPKVSKEEEVERENLLAQ